MVTILLVLPVVSLGCSDQILTEYLHSAPSHHLFADLSHQGKGRGFSTHLEGSLGVENFIFLVLHSHFSHCLKKSLLSPYLCSQLTSPLEIPVAQLQTEINPVCMLISEMVGLL